MVDGRVQSASVLRAERLESDALVAQTPLRSSHAGLPLQSFVVRAERAGGARLGRALLVIIISFRPRDSNGSNGIGSEGV